MSEHAEHEYISTACQHGLHSRCIMRCKFCNVRCQCGCDHTVEDETTLTEYLADAIAAGLHRWRDERDEVLAEIVVKALRKVPPGGVDLAAC